MTPRARFLLAAVSLGLGAISALGQSIVLGVLEDVPGAYAGEASWAGVRTVFHKDGGQWAAYSTACTEPTECQETAEQFPAGGRWTIGFDGRSVGEVSTRKSDDADLGSHIGLQKVADAASVPRVGKRSAEFGGFLARPVYRPLVANSQPYVADPDTWTVAPAPSDVLPLLRKAFRERYPKLCRPAEGAGPEKSFAYTDDVVVVQKAYHAKAGWWLARLHVAHAVACGDDQAGFAMDDPWFAVAPARTVKYLDRGMWLVDAGDYDNDGRSELMFAIDRYNQGGYVLYYNAFEGRVSFEYSYH